jgi:integrase/recombinase XerD
MGLPSKQSPKEELLAMDLSVRDSYGSAIADFLRFLEANHLSLDLSAVKAYFTHLNASPLAAGTKCVRRQAVKARLRAALADADLDRQAKLEMKLRSLDRGTDTKAPGIVRAGVAEDRVITTAEFDLLVSGTSRRTSLFLWFLYNTGCRAAEMCGARLDRCEHLGDMVRITITGKGRKERKVEIEKRLFDAIRAEFGGATWVFQTGGGKPLRPAYVSYEIIKAGRRLLGRRISAHTMRHSFATMAIREGASIKAVSEYLGHSTTAITMDMYVHEHLEKRQKVRRPFG